MSADIIKFACNSVELVYKMLKSSISPLFLDSFLYWSVAMPVAVFRVWRHETRFHGGHTSAVWDCESVTSYPRMTAAFMLLFIASILQGLLSSQRKHVWDVNTSFFFLLDNTQQVWQIWLEILHFTTLSRTNKTPTSLCSYLSLFLSLSLSLVCMH
jgi:uncharacterized protein with PQ loop repeat